MATLQTGGFGLRTLPQLQRVNPADFRVDPRAATEARTAELNAAAELERLRSIQRTADIERATQGDREALARLQSSAAVDDFPLQRDSANVGLQAGMATNRLGMEQAGQNLESLQVNRDVIASTADQDALNRLRASQQAQEISEQERALTEREIARREAETGSLVNQRAAMEEVNRLRADNDRLRAEAQMKRAESGGGNQMQLQVKPIMGGPLGDTTIGFERMIFNRNTGEIETIRDMIDGSNGTGAGPDLGALMPGGGGAAPTTGSGSAQGSVQAPAPTNTLSTPQDLVQAVRLGQLTAMEAKVIAVRNGWRPAE